MSFLRSDPAWSDPEESAGWTKLISFAQISLEESEELPPWSYGREGTDG